MRKQFVKERRENHGGDAWVMELLQMSNGSICGLAGFRYLVEEEGYI